MEENRGVSGPGLGPCEALVRRRRIRVWLEAGGAPTCRLQELPPCRPHPHDMPSVGFDQVGYPLISGVNESVGGGQRAYRGVLLAWVRRRGKRCPYVRLYNLTGSTLGKGRAG